MPDNNNIRDMFIGLDEEVEYEGGKRAAVNLDSAATTPPLVRVVEEIQKQMLMYGSIGRGTGQKSKYSSKLYTRGRATILDFVGADRDKYEVIYVGSTTDGMNKLASALLGTHRELVLTTRMEHHANDLPWQERGRTVYVDVDDKYGRLNMDEFERILIKYNRYIDYNKKEVKRDTIKYVAVTAASNVTGNINDVHKIAAIAHKYGAKIIVDGAQIVAHRAFSMKGSTPDEDIDFFVFSAHKMYSPFGGGAIVGLKDVLNSHLPVFYGGGMVDMVSDDDVVYSAAPDRYEAGSPNYPGVVGMLEAIRVLNEVGFDVIKKHEEELLKYAIEGLSSFNKKDDSGESNAMKEVLFYGDCVNYTDRVGILVFNLTRFQNDFVADYLARHAAIAVRHAKFCAHTYVNRLLTTVRPFSSYGACVHVGMVRVSFGLYTTKEDIDALIAAIRDLLESELTASAVMARMDMVPADTIGMPNDRG